MRQRVGAITGGERGGLPAPPGSMEPVPAALLGGRRPPGCAVRGRGVRKGAAPWGGRCVGPVGAGSLDTGVRVTPGSGAGGGWTAVKGEGMNFSGEVSNTCPGFGGAPCRVSRQRDSQGQRKRVSGRCGKRRTDPRSSPRLLNAYGAPAWVGSEPRCAAGARDGEGAGPSRRRRPGERGRKPGRIRGEERRAPEGRARLRLLRRGSRLRPRRTHPDGIEWDGDVLYGLTSHRRVLAGARLPAAPRAIAPVAPQRGRAPLPGASAASAAGSAQRNRRGARGREQ